MARKARNYRREYDTYHAKPAQRKRRTLRNAARAKMLRKHGKAKLRGKDVHHKRGMSNRSSNLAVVSVRKNRGYRRSKTGKNLGLRKRRT